MRPTWRWQEVVWCSMKVVFLYSIKVVVLCIVDALLRYGCREGMDAQTCCGLDEGMKN